MLTWTREQLLAELNKDLKWHENALKNNYSDLGYWSSMAKIAFLKKNIEYVKTPIQP